MDEKEFELIAEAGLLTSAYWLIIITLNFDLLKDEVKRLHSKLKAYIYNALEK